MCKTLALLSLDSVSQTSLQHWAGLFCFGAGFRRPLSSIVQEIFPFIQDPRWEKLDRLPCPESVLDEMLVGALLTPFAGTNLRAPIRNAIGCSDASEQGGAAAEPSSVLSGLCRSTLNPPRIGTPVWLKKVFIVLLTLGQRSPVQMFVVMSVRV